MVSKRTLAFALALFFLLALTPGESKVTDESATDSSLEFPTETIGPEQGILFTPLHYAAFGGHEMVALHLANQ